MDLREAIARLSVLADASALGLTPWAVATGAILCAATGRRAAAWMPLALGLGALLAVGWSAVAAFLAPTSDRARDAVAQGWVHFAHAATASAVAAMVTAAVAPRDAGAHRDDRLVLTIVSGGLGSLVLIHAIAVFGGRLVLGQLVVVTTAVCGTLVLAHGRYAARHEGRSRAWLVATAVGLMALAAHGALQAESWSLPREAPISDVLRPIDDVGPLRVTCAGAAAQAVLVAAWLSPRGSPAAVRLPGLWVAVASPFIAVGALWSAAGPGSGGRLGADGVDLPRAFGPLPSPTASCVRTLTGDVWRRLPAVACGAQDLLVAAGSARASELLDAASWGSHEVLARAPAIGSNRGPLAQSDLVAVAMELRGESVPTEIDEVGGALAAWDAWLERVAPGPSATLWVVDGADGSMLLLHALRGLPLDDDERRNRVFRTYLADAHDPRVALVAGSRWTVQQVVDLCLEARRAAPGQEVRCTVVRSGSAHSGMRP